MTVVVVAVVAPGAPPPAPWLALVVMALGIVTPQQARWPPCCGAG